MINITRTMSGAALALAVATPGTAGPKSPNLASCDGKSRRPANPFGTTLPSVDPAAAIVTPPTAGRGGIDIFPPADPAKTKRSGKAPPSPDDTAPTSVPPIGAIDPSPRFRSC